MPTTPSLFKSLSRTGTCASPSVAPSAAADSTHPGSSPSHASSPKPLHSHSASRVTPPTTPVSPHFTLLAHYQPASWTIALLLEELGLTYTIVPMGVPGVGGCGTLVDTEAGVVSAVGLGTGDEYGSTRVEVSGTIRVPALVDHANGDLVLMEMGAVVLYLVERYAGRPTGILHELSSTSKKAESMVQGWVKCGLCPEDEEEKQLAKQWLVFSVTEHSPTFTHLSHFLYNHPHRLPSAIAHFTTHLHVVLSTLNSALASSPSEYLLPHTPGPTYADFVFWAWHWVFESGGFPTADGDRQCCWEQYPLVGQWQARMAERDSVKRVVEEWERIQLEYV